MASHSGAHRGQTKRRQVGQPPGLIGRCQGSVASPLHLALNDTAHSGFQTALMRYVNYVLLFPSGVSTLSQLPTLPADVED